MNDRPDSPSLFVVTKAVAEVSQGHARTLATTCTTHHRGREDAERVVVVGLEGELFGSLGRGAEVLRTQADAADPGPLEADQVVELVRGSGELPGPGRGCGRMRPRALLVRSA